jgi:hypothetical protein
MNLRDRYEQMTPEQRVDLAKKAGTSPAYLWQLANRWGGRRASLELIQRLAQADKKLSVNDMVAQFLEPVE